GNTLPVAGDALTIKGTATIDNSASTNNIAYGDLSLGSGPTTGTIQWAVGGTNVLNVNNINAGSAAGCAIDMTNGGTLTIRGSFSLTNNTFTAGAGTVNYAGASQTIAATTYNNLHLSGSGTKTLAGDIIVNGDLTIDPGV